MSPECDCDIRGVETPQCNKTNGSCNCLRGIVGAKCDKCARGTKGSAPSCEKCGECFDNWDAVFNKLNGIIYIKKKFNIKNLK